jgi:hypothetical protein
MIAGFFTAWPVNTWLIRRHQESHVTPDGSYSGTGRLAVTP